MFALTCTTKPYLSAQDFPISVSIIWNQWRSNKMSDEDCERELVRCKDRSSPTALQALDQIRKRSLVLKLEDEIKDVQDTLKKSQSPFRDHPDVTKFQKQFEMSTYGRMSRFRTLVLVGATQQGKTAKGMSLWGSARTLKVSCGNCGEGVLPSLAGFNRHHHDAILFDEARIDQILKNRELFQSNEHLQTLGQSACNPFAYSIWVYHKAMIVCCNNFDVEDEDISEPDREWLLQNTIRVELPKAERWYIKA